MTLPFSVYATFVVEERFGFNRTNVRTYVLDLIKSALLSAVIGGGILLLVVWIYVKLAALPGQKATERGHPQAEAINVLGWIGLLLGIAPWLVALVWAYTKPSPMWQEKSDAQSSGS